MKYTKSLLLGALLLIGIASFATAQNTVQISLTWLANSWLKTQTFKSVAETVCSPAISSGTLTIDLSCGTVFVVSHNANITTINVINVPSGVASFTVKFVAAGFTSQPTWGGSFHWQNNNTPTLSGTTNHYDWVGFTTVDGSNFDGFIGGVNYQ